MLAKCVPVSHLHIGKRVPYTMARRELAEYKSKVNNEQKVVQIRVKVTVLQYKPLQKSR